MIYLGFVPVSNHRTMNAGGNYTERERSDHFGVSIRAKQSAFGKREVLHIHVH